MTLASLEISSYATVDVEETGKGPPSTVKSRRCCIITTSIFLGLVLVALILPFMLPQRDEFGVYLDGWNKVPVPRVLLEHGPAEIFYSLPLDHNPSVKVNSQNNTVLMPWLTTLKVRYVRNTPSIGTFEYGVGNWKWFANPVALFSDKVIGGTAEKVLTLSHKGSWSTRSKEMAKADQADRFAFTAWLASALRYLRSYLLNCFLFLNRPGTQLTSSVLSESVRQELREFVEKEDAKPPPMIQPLIKAWRKNLTAEAEKLVKPASLDEFEQAAVNCFHFEGDTGAFTTEEGFFLPLGKKLAAYRAQMTAGPLRTFNVISGVVVVEHNKADNKLEFYFYATNYLNMFDPQLSDVALPSPAVYVSPMPGEPVSSVGPDSRMNSAMQRPSTILHVLHSVYRSIPMDYTYLFQDPEDTCSKDKYTALNQSLWNLDADKFVHGNSGWADLFGLISTLTNAADCGTPYLRAAVMNSNGMDLMETIGWAHFIMETPPHQSVSLIAYRGWNNFSLVDIVQQPE